jgi:hypothetical protein
MSFSAFTRSSGNDETAPQKWAALRKKFDVKEINVADSNDHITELSALFDPIVVVGPEAVAAQL